MPRRFELYQYDPSVVAAGIVAGIFGISAVWHGTQIFRTKGWYFLPMLLGVLMEVIGYIGRIISSRDKDKLGPYILQTLLLLLAPAFFAASIYVVLGRIIVALHAEKFSLIRVQRLTKFFVAGDVLSFLIQSGGGGLMASEAKAKIGQKIVLVGLIIQIFWFGFFVIVSVVFHTRMRKITVSSEHRHWVRLIWSLYVASSLILVRSVFRLIEFGQGHEGYLMSKEVYLYVFDAVLMIITVFIFNVFHPPTYLKQMNELEHATVLAERVHY